MAAWTAIQLRNAALTFLNVTHRNQTPRAEDAQLVDDLWASEYPRLASRGLAPFSSNSLPEWAQEPFRRYLAARAAPLFGYSGERLAIMMQAGKEAEVDIRTHLNQKKRETTSFTDY